MSNVTDKLLDHDYDGIREYDNPLPRWWVYMFYGTVLFAVVYFPYYQWGPGLLPAQAYEQDMEEWNKLHPQVEFLPEAELMKFVTDDGKLATGKKIFSEKCAACHLADGGGLVGPNLTDDFSIHGYSMESIVKVIYEGVPAKGMIPWGPQLSVDEIYAVSSYVHSLRGKTPAKAKDPQGDPIK